MKKNLFTFLSLFLICNVSLRCGTETVNPVASVNLDNSTLSVSANTVGFVSSETLTFESNVEKLNSRKQQKAAVRTQSSEDQRTILFGLLDDQSLVPVLTVDEKSASQNNPILLRSLKQDNDTFIFLFDTKVQVDDQSCFLVRLETGGSKECIDSNEFSASLAVGSLSRPSAEIDRFSFALVNNDSSIVYPSSVDPDDETKGSRLVRYNNQGARSLLFESTPDWSAEKYLLSGSNEWIGFECIRLDSSEDIVQRERVCKFSSTDVAILSTSFPVDLNDDGFREEVAFYPLSRDRILITHDNINNNFHMRFGDIGSEITTGNYSAQLIFRGDMSEGFSASDYTRPVEIQAVFQRTSLGTEVETIGLEENFESCETNCGFTQMVVNSNDKTTNEFGVGGELSLSAIDYRIGQSNGNWLLSFCPLDLSSNCSIRLIGQVGSGSEVFNENIRISSIRIFSGTEALVSGPTFDSEGLNDQHELHLIDVSNQSSELLVTSEQPIAFILID